MTGRLVSAASGLAWGLVGFWFFRDTNLSGSAWVGLLASPGIGLFIGTVVARSKTRGPLRPIILGLVNLYLAVALFAMAVGVGHVAFHWGELPVPESSGRASAVVGIVEATLLGLTLSGLVLFFWPLSCANHLLLDAVAGRDAA